MSSAGIRRWWRPSPTRWRFEHKYTSGVIAWAPEDRPTEAQIEAVLDKFEATLELMHLQDRERGIARRRDIDWSR